MEVLLQSTENLVNYEDTSAYLKENLDVSDAEVSKIITFIYSLKEKRKEEVDIDKLTKREAEIFRLVVKGINTKAIAKKLFISHATVSTHRKKIKEKLKLNSILDWYSLSNKIGT